MKKLFKNEIGITLVALVITIIILLILAGISIAQLTGSGLFKNAKLAKEKSDDAQKKEDGILSDYENKIGEYLETSTRLNKEDYEQIMNMFYPNKSLTITDFTDTTTEQTYTIPNSGWLYIKAARKAVGHTIKFYRNDMEIMQHTGVVTVDTNAALGYNTVYIPVRKGDVIRKTQDGTNFIVRALLYYYE